MPHEPNRKAGFHPPPRRTEHADFPHSALLFASQEDLWNVANWRYFRARGLTSIYSTPSNHFRLPLLVDPLSQVLQIAERFYQTPLPPIIARGIAKQLGPFAPRELPQFIATTNPSATFSPSFLFPVSAGYRSDLLQSVSLWDEEGFSSCSTCPCHRAVPTTPPKCHAASVSPRHVMLPSPRTRGLGLRISVFFRGHLWVYFRYGPVTRSPSLRWLCRSASPASLSSAGTTQAKDLLTFLLL